MLDVERRTFKAFTIVLVTTHILVVGTTPGMCDACDKRRFVQISHMITYNLDADLHSPGSAMTALPADSYKRPSMPQSYNSLPPPTANIKVAVCDCSPTVNRE